MAENLSLTKSDEGTMKVYEDNDRFFDVLWQHIDDAKDIICI
jgi:phosphatidylserine/phosphatidylglycerophosphate/cardiolipin synthase-like enzyme